MVNLSLTAEEAIVYSLLLHKHSKGVCDAAMLKVMKSKLSKALTASIKEAKAAQKRGVN